MIQGRVLEDLISTCGTPARFMPSKFILAKVQTRKEENTVRVFPHQDNGNKTKFKAICPANFKEYLCVHNAYSAHINGCSTNSFLC